MTDRQRQNERERWKERGEVNECDRHTTNNERQRDIYTYT